MVARIIPGPACHHCHHSIMENLEYGDRSTIPLFFDRSMGLDLGYGAPVPVFRG